ncbi:hypothetical protein K493DRAFT_24895 [Basidiobolus meristosporus CBS 931.73]|uniref:AMP-dependent synthetase/ligase domain-containing protein n=1 Tax=Basidiobolus meristosporus CBS 931.73 TaxID=1314790 RepID=A0A1Y1YCS2_9FUNG|nr:hypothetical protein K493DRAFT_24895 [Basidiobolus meristosporus CBS 931.73]|eukprot:ORX95414.1 hypothetical protein K493DRAFT_24895 [Basidiobolus meristosporus CBS 931.73]
MVPAFEKQLLSVDRNSPVFTNVTGVCIHHLFEQQVELSPDRDAFQFEDMEPVTYKELNRQANRLAHLLDVFAIYTDDTNPAVASLTPSHLCYVIFTSGSTDG